MLLKHIVAYITRMGDPRAEISIPIAEAAADALQTPIEELPPLSNSVDVDGLDALVSNDPDHDVAITFPYAGLQVHVHSDDIVYVHPNDDGRRDPRANAP